ncbi:MAG: hypothetical protein R3208_06205 [Ketobacteraceae bacterium]|nr:hypothetical protein [Ketobacteraceae bacterium]
MRILSLVMLVLWLGACQMPSEEAVISDSSAGISFRILSDSKQTYEVYVDGLMMGKARDFKEGDAILKILPGSHVIKILSNGAVVLEEKLYVAAGANKVLVVK